ncbi:MAG: hypothetical protein A2Y17_11745 [Clostridiales bacterium GWF2_38_85]|nr:MAG: hypothetical protein A2Y17_11745 [Clostridiales bacterium GWF2_38_85]HBL85375.1 endolytic transglycosylase MltG [Clostridiales bacterium]
MSDNPKNNNSENEIGENIDEILEILDKYKLPEQKTAVKEKTEPDSIESTQQTIKINDSATAHFTEIIDATAVRQGKNDMTMHFAPVQNEDESEEEEKEAVEDEVELESLPRKKKKRKKDKENLGLFGIFSGVFKTIMYLIFVIGVAAYVSYNVIKIGNEVFAFVKPETEVNITITENMTTAQVAELLEEKGVIEFDWVFKLYAKYRSDVDSYIPGEYTISCNSNYDEIVTKFTVVEVAREVVKITIPEGFTVDQIIDLLTSNGVGQREDYINVINNHPFKHEFMVKLNTLDLSEDRIYRLEGYLFPDTYFFYQDDDEVDVINKMLNAFEDKFDISFYDRCDELGMTLDEVITLASMVEAESKFAIDLECVSSVFHNRLNNWAEDKKFLQSDATIQYVLPEHKEDLSQADKDLNNPYNTYVYKGLPPGAICNPGIDAITAALWPDDPLDANGKSFTAYFFVSNKYGKTYYAMTDAGHDVNKKQVEKDNAEYDAIHQTESTTD